MKCLCGHFIGEHKVRYDGSRGGCTHKGKGKCNCRRFECGHWRVKKNYSHGRKSRADKYCKDCGKIVTNKFLEKRREGERR